MHKLRKSARGVLGLTQVNALSDAHTAWIKVKEIGRGKKRASVGGEYSCHFPSLTVGLPRKWLASPSFGHAESRRVHRPPVQFEQTPLRHQGRRRAAAATVTAAQMSTATAVADASWAGPVGGESEGKDGQHPSIQLTTNLTNKDLCRRSGSSIPTLVVLCLRSSGDSVRPAACCPPKPSSRAGSQATPATRTARVGGALDGLGKGVRARASARSSMCTAADCRCGPRPRRPPGCGKWRRRRKVVKRGWEGEGARNMFRHPATSPMSAALRGGSSAFAFASATATAATAFGTARRPIGGSSAVLIPFVLRPGGRGGPAARISCSRWGTAALCPARTAAWRTVHKGATSGVEIALSPVVRGRPMRGAPAASPSSRPAWPLGGGSRCGRGFFDQPRRSGPRCGPVPATAEAAAAAAATPTPAAISSSPETARSRLSATRLEGMTLARPLRPSPPFPAPSQPPAPARPTGRSGC